jgi:hypothetical protein
VTVEDCAVTAVAAARTVMIEKSILILCKEWVGDGLRELFSDCRYESRVRRCSEEKA